MGEAPGLRPLARQGTRRGARWGWRAVVGVVAGLAARLWIATLRVTVVLDPGLDRVEGRPWVLAFLHGTQWPLLAWPRRRRTLVMVSWSADGMIQASAMKVLGFSVVRGSSSRGGARGLVELVRGLRGGDADVALAVDGPRGPYGVAKGGARAAARAGGGVLVPVGAAVASGLTLTRAWDRFAIAWPFSRVAVYVGSPLEPAARQGAGDDELGRAIAAANDRAQALLPGPTPMAHGAGAGLHPDGAVRPAK